MGKQLTYEEYQNICALHKSGMKQRNIAVMVGKSPATICEIVKQGGRVKFKKNGGIRIIDKGIECSSIDEKDFSTLPDNVFFKHDGTFIF